MLIGRIRARQLDDKVGCTGTLGRGAGTSRGQGWVQQTTRCAREVSLGVEQGSTRQLVGFIRAGTPFTITDCRPDLVRITARDIGLMPFKASFYVETSSLASCTLRAPPRLGDARRRQAPH